MATIMTELLKRLPLPIPPTTAALTESTTDSGEDVNVYVNKTTDPIYINPGDTRFFGLGMGLFVIAVGAVGNALTVWAYGRNRNLQTSFNVLIANLCWVELLFSLVILPLQLPGYITQEPVYPDGLCTAIGYFYYSSLASSLQNLVAIAVNRYVGIVDTKRYQKLFTGTRLRMTVISIWLVPPILYLPVVIGGLINWDTTSLRCAIGTNTGIPAIRIYNTLLNVIYQAGSLILLCVLYTAIMKKVRKVQKKLKMHKQSSFTSTSRAKKAKLKKMDSKNKDGSTYTPGTTSGEETPDEFRPSSLISGGFQFRPAKEFPHRDMESDSAHGTDHELDSRINKHISDNTKSHNSCDTLSNEPSPRPQKRMSLWTVLFRKRAEEEKKRDTMEEPRPEPSATSSTHNTTEIRKNEEVVILRNMNPQMKEIRRKKSLSAPTLPALDEIIQSRKNSAAVAQSIPDEVKEEIESENEISPGLHRAFTVGSRYKKKKASALRTSDYTGDSMLTAAQMNLLVPGDLSNRLSGVVDKPFCSSMPSLVPPQHSDTPTHKRMGTIARKIRDHKKSKKKKKDSKTRQRQRALRRRHARERQLVYSSLMICIAFAVCILPTALLHLFQVTLDLQVAASVILVVSCISWLHAVANPFIYGYMNHLYRNEYNHIAKELEQKIAKCFK